MLALDINFDGYNDTFCYDTNGDGYYDTVHIDINQDGIVDYMQVDMDLDGIRETVYADVNGDGVLDLYGYDQNGDGYVDIFVDYSQPAYSPGSYSNSAAVNTQLQPYTYGKQLDWQSGHDQRMSEIGWGTDLNNSGGIGDYS